jgi:hypothetical protein
MAADDLAAADALAAAQLAEVRTADRAGEGNNLLNHCATIGATSIIEIFLRRNYLPFSSATDVPRHWRKAKSARNKRSAAPASGHQVSCPCMPFPGDGV